MADIIDQTDLASGDSARLAEAMALFKQEIKPLLHTDVDWSNRLLIAYSNLKTLIPENHAQTIFTEISEGQFKPGNYKDYAPAVRTCLQEMSEANKAWEANGTLIKALLDKPEFQEIDHGAKIKAMEALKTTYTNSFNQVPRRLVFMALGATGACAAAAAMGGWALAHRKNQAAPEPDKDGTDGAAEKSRER